MSYNTFDEECAARPVPFGADGSYKAAVWTFRGRQGLAVAVVGASVLLVAVSAGMALRSRADVTVLMPLDFKRDVSDAYKAKKGGEEEQAQMKDYYGSWERTSRDKRAEHSLHTQQDYYAEAGHSVPLGAAGGPVASSEGGQIAWYGNWWNGMHFGELIDTAKNMTGLRNLHGGSERLIDAGINVQGWEPGRKTDQVIRDQKTGKDIPHGFWEANGNPAFRPDVAMHHPCGSPLRKRPCEEDEEEPVKAGGPEDPRKVDTAWHSVNGTVDGELWKDPVP